MNSEVMSTKRRIWLTDEQRTTAVTRYKSGDSPDAIADSFGVCANNIRNALRRAGVEMRDRSQARTKLKLRTDAFNVITPESAYWIGFLFADGSLSPRSVGAPVLAVGISEKDEAHLHKLRAFLGSEHKITRYQQRVSKTVPRGNTFWAVRLSIRSAHLGADLRRHGMCNKSLERVAPLHLAVSRDFWRGLVDGDGHVGCSNKKPRLGLCGGVILMHEFLDFLQGNGIGRDTNVRRGGQIHRVDLNCSTAIAAMKLLYDDACVALSRKHRRALALISGDVRQHIAE